MMEITHDYRCACGKLLFRGMILSGAIEVKCRSCKRIETIESFRGSAEDTERYVLVLDARGVLMRFSASAPAILGYKSEELLKKSVSDIIVMLSAEFYSSLWKAFSTKGPTIFLFQSLQRHKDQGMSPVEIEAQYLPGVAPTLVFTVRKKIAARLPDDVPSIR